MRITHHIGAASSEKIQSELAVLGIKVASDGLVTFEIDEGNPAWPEVSKWVAERGLPDVINTTFSDEELDAASWLELAPDWHHGYPQPRENTYGYLAATYDLSNYCERCGIGKRQIAPFQLKGEPKWGRRSILQLNWVFDEFFVTPEVWAAVFEPTGISKIPVMNTRAETLKTVVQLEIREEVDIDTSGLEPDECGTCGRTRDLPLQRGPFPKLTGKAARSAAAVRTRQWFGGGISSSNRVLVNDSLRNALRSHKVTGASFRPVSDS